MCWRHFWLRTNHFGLSSSFPLTFTFPPCFLPPPFHPKVDSFTVQWTLIERTKDQRPKMWRNEEHKSWHRSSPSQHTGPGLCTENDSTPWLRGHTSQGWSEESWLHFIFATWKNCFVSICTGRPPNVIRFSFHKSLTKCEEKFVFH